MGANRSLENCWIAVCTGRVSAESLEPFDGHAAKDKRSPRQTS